jgi:hypothetical protein
VGLIIQSLAVPATANTVFSPEPGSCQIIGDGDVYGPGIRLSYYLQWASGIISTLIDAPDDINRSRTAANIITLAVFINCIRDSIEDGLMSIEWIIVSYLVLVSNLGLLPWRWDMLYEGRSSLGWSLILLCIQWLIEPWLYFSGIKQGIKEGCELKIQNPVAYDIQDSRYAIASQVGSVLMVIIAVLTLWPAITLLTWDVMAEIDPKELRDSQLPYLIRMLKRKYDSHIRGRSRMSSRGVRYLWLLGQIIVGPISIASIEGTLRLNDIDLSAAPLTGAGQLIPFLAGAFSLGITFISVLRKLVKAMGYRRNRDKGEVGSIEMRQQNQQQGQDPEHGNKGVENCEDRVVPCRDLPESMEHIFQNQDSDPPDVGLRQRTNSAPKILRHAHTD